MGDGLTISGGGDTAVATDELFVDAARLGAAAAVIDTWVSSAATLASELDAVDLDGGDGGWAEPAPSGAMRRVEQTLRRCSGTADELPEGAVPGHAANPRDELVERVGGGSHHAHEHRIRKQPVLRTHPLVEWGGPEQPSRRGIHTEPDG